MGIQPHSTPLQKVLKTLVVYLKKEVSQVRELKLILARVLYSRPLTKSKIAGKSIRN